MSTKGPGEMLYPRLYVGLVLIVDSMRGWGLSPFLGSSAIENLSLSHDLLAKFVCAIQAACGIMIATGFLTRLAILPAIALWSIEVSRAWRYVGSLGTSRAIDETLLAVGVVAVGIMLLFRGAGVWSVDAILS